MSFGRPRHHHRLTDSTNDRARELAEAGAPSGTLVTADEQSAGRGRRGRTWSALAGKALLGSFVLRPLDERHALLPLAVPLAVCDAIEEVSQNACRVKWPNDVWIEERKVAGVLIEARPPQWAVLGVGVNVAIEPAEFPDDLRWPATSIGRGAGVEQTLHPLADSLRRWTEATPEAILGAYAERDALRGRRIAWDGDSGAGSGTAEGIDSAGNLVVATDAGSVKLGSGEVQLELAVY
jgi:BirA family transcriptional regulator, biotin operon repressor / biotin---[acetyl-CoA-carboxylase] ligase